MEIDFESCKKENELHTMAKRAKSSTCKFSIINVEKEGIHRPIVSKYPLTL